MTNDQARLEQHDIGETSSRSWFKWRWCKAPRRIESLFRSPYGR